jgi:hypothetical protein
LKEVSILLFGLIGGALVLTIGTQLMKQVFQVGFRAGFEIGVLLDVIDDLTRVGALAGRQRGIPTAE